MTKSSVSVDVAGTTVQLLAAKALYRPDARMLCIADAHFGKAAAYRALGQPVPGGTTASNLARIDELLGEYDVEKLVFLGDLFHAKQSLTADVVAAMTEWRQRHPVLDCVLVLGNHDRRAGVLPASLRIETVVEPHCVGRFALCHESDAVGAAATGLHVLSGHVHPVFELRGNARQSVRLPCFVSNAHATLLPSFGDFTGGFDIVPAQGDRVFVTDGASIWQVR